MPTENMQIPFNYDSCLRKTSAGYGQKHCAAVSTIKTLLKKASTLEYYKTNGKMTVSVEANSKALGAVLLQNDKLVAYASATLTPAQQSYPKIEIEALTVTYGCNKFNQYIYRRYVKI